MRRTGDVWVALALTALLAGCSDPQAGPLPSVSFTPSDSPTGSQSSSALSEVAATVRAYYAALAAAVHDPARNTRALDELLDPSCPCREIVGVLNDEARRGRHADYSLAVTALTVPRETANSGTAYATVVQSPGHLFDSSGRVVENIPAMTRTYFIDVRTRNARWVVLRVTAK
jgi:hypothetical protein